MRCPPSATRSYTRCPYTTLFRSELGRLGGGFGHLIDELPRERLELAVSAVAHAQGALEKTIEYVTTRKAFGTPIASFQNTRFELAKAKTDIEVHRAYMEKCKQLYADRKSTRLNSSH